MPSEPLRKHWIDGALPSFVVQLVLSTVGAVLLGIVLVLVPALVIAAVTKPPGSSLIDRMISLSFESGRTTPTSLALFSLVLSSEYSATAGSVLAQRRGSGFFLP